MTTPISAIFESLTAPRRRQYCLKPDAFGVPNEIGFGELPCDCSEAWNAKGFRDDEKRKCEQKSRVNRDVLQKRPRTRRMHKVPV